MINYIIFLAVYAIIYERKYRMLITGILITIVAIFMVLVPQFFVKLKSPRIPDGLLKNPKMKIVLRIWGVIFIMVGILLIIFSMVR